MEHHTITSVGWLSLQPAPFQKRLLAASETLTFAPGATINLLDDPPRGLFGVARGYCDVLIAPSVFPPRLVHIARPGWWLGDAASATQTTRRAEVVARTEVDVVHVPAAALEEIALEDPTLWRRVATITVQHLDDALVLASSMMTDDLRLRLLVNLTRLAHRTETPQGSLVELPINQVELGEMAGLSRNTVGRLLAALEREGCVAKRYGNIVIDPERVRASLRDFWQARASA